MKLGAENSKKTIAAAALFLVAIVMFVRMMAGSSSSSGSVTPTATPGATTSPVRQARRPSTKKGARAKAEKASGPVTPSLDPRLNLAQLKETEETPYDGKGRNIFMATEEPLPTAVDTGFKKPGPNSQTPPPPPQQSVYVPPPIPLKFFGFASGPDHKKVFLAQGDDVFVASEGEIVQRRYKIVKINNNNIEVLDVLSNNRQTIPLTAG